METNPLRGLFGVSSPRPVEQRVSPQPTKNIYFEIPSGMIEKLLANPFAGDGTLYPDLHLIFVDEVCGLFKIAGIPDGVFNRKVFPLSLKGDTLTCYMLCDDTRSWNYKRLKLEFHQKFYPITTKKYTSVIIRVCHSRSRFFHACTSMMILHVENPHWSGLLTGYRIQNPTR